VKACTPDSKKRSFAEKQFLTNSLKRFLYAAWLLMICGFAVLHLLHLRADFPNHTAWFSDWAKYTDEGWYANAAVRAHLSGHWYVHGDFNPAPAVPVWPLLVWVVFCFTGVTIEAARGLAVGFFFCNLFLSYLLLRVRANTERPRWVGLLALTLLVTSPFLYSFSRLAILEPMLTALTLTALNLAIRLPRLRFPLLASAAVGVLFTLMMLTKTTAVFLLPALGWAMLFPLRQNLKLALRSALAASAAFAATFGLWMGLVIHSGLLADYKYLFFINKYVKPPEFYWPLLSLWWSFHGGLWVDHILIPLAGALSLAGLWMGRAPAGRKLLLDPVFGASVLAAAGYILFMTYQNHPQPRYFALVAVFCFFIVALGVEALLSQSGRYLRGFAFAALALTVAAVGINGATTLNFSLHPEYTFVDAAQKLTRYIDEHPNGNRLLVSISGDEISLVTHLPTLCDDFGTQEFVSKLGAYKPGWWATWNDIDPGTLEDLHNRYSLEQVASFRAFDDPERNVMVLFKLHPLPPGVVRDGSGPALQVPLPGDKIEIPVE
jgi:hypothetical protein